VPTSGGYRIFGHKRRHQPGDIRVIKEHRLPLNDHDIVSLIGSFQREHDGRIGGDVAQLLRVPQAKH
jgi:hypothetical protein